MRVLCSFAGGAGHLVPQLPLHRALADAGHELTLVGRESATSAAPGATYANLVTRPDRRSRPADTIAPLAPVDRAHELAVVGRHFAGSAAVRAGEQLGAIIGGVDLVVCDEFDFGAMAAARAAGIQCVVVAVTASGALVRPVQLTGPLAALGRKLAVPQRICARGDAFVVPFHPAMRDPDHPAPVDTLWMQPEPARAVPTDHGPEPQVIATLGTEFNTESGDLFDRILAALRTSGTPATVAIGRDLSPARFGAQPEHLRVQQFLDLDEVLPAAGVVVHHGGSGVFLRAVLTGTPQVVLPMGADQPFTADTVQRLGLGVVLDPITATPDEIAGAIARVAGDVSMTAAADRLKQEMLDLPTASEVVQRLDLADRRSR